MKETGAKDDSKVWGLMELPSPEIRMAEGRAGFGDRGKIRTSGLDTLNLKHLTIIQVEILSKQMAIRVW